MECSSDSPHVRIIIRKFRGQCFRAGSKHTHTHSLTPPLCIRRGCASLCLRVTNETRPASCGFGESARSTIDGQRERVRAALAPRAPGAAVADRLNPDKGEAQGARERERGNAKRGSKGTVRLCRSLQRRGEREKGGRQREKETRRESFSTKIDGPREPTGNCPSSPFPPSSSFSRM